MKKVKAQTVLLLLSLFSLFLLSSCVFQSGTILIKENDQGTKFEIKLSNWSEKTTCMLSMRKGEVIQVNFECEKGSIALDIIGKKGKHVYSGNGLVTNRFTININETDEYIIALKGDGVSGKLVLEKISSEME